VDTPVPIPGAFLLMGSVLAGAGGLSAWRRRRARAA
jgi:LPXTG-motif cell wall-anchored protein